ncbi:MAG: hypothetical protein Faunusvirus5_20 [Faunusvirus sp.]|jgi:hypothetical protein|uniref:Uncharacterized protein n=1 Tax=Faunusvirus sp. TaxID=2487766 RepID=A0A3G4ZYX9_9VIRU|nr:MAG: hypothetical protein Faunusvirus5_20 [Faunusvirus sp.]
MNRKRKIIDELDMKHSGAQTHSDSSSREKKQKVDDHDYKMDDESMSAEKKENKNDDDNSDDDKSGDDGDDEYNGDEGDDGDGDDEEDDGEGDDSEEEDEGDDSEEEEDEEDPEEDEDSHDPTHPEETASQLRLTSDQRATLRGFGADHELMDGKLVGCLIKIHVESLGRLMYYIGSTEDIQDLPRKLDTRFGCEQKIQIYKVVPIPGRRTINALCRKLKRQNQRFLLKGIKNEYLYEHTATVYCEFFKMCETLSVS